MKKKISLIILSFFLLFSIQNVNALEQKEAVFINDYADVITKDTKNYMIEYSSFIKENFDIDFEVVTIKSLNNKTLEDYSNEIYKEFEIGDNGLLIFVGTEDRVVRVVVGKNLSFLITNDLIDKYINNYFIPFLETNEWDKGIKNGYTAFYRTICNYYNVDATELPVVNGNSFLNKYRNGLMFIDIWCCTIIGYILSNYFKNKIDNNKRKRKRKTKLNDEVIFVISVFVNILLLYYGFYINPWYVLILLGFEGISIYSNYTSNTTPKKKIKKK